ITLEVKPGELVVLLGANGAGKTTLFNTISGLMKPTSGSVHFIGNDVTGKKPSSLVSAGMVQCPEGRKLFPEMSVLKNLTSGSYVHSKDTVGIQCTLRQVLDMFAILGETKHGAAGCVSGGNQQMVAMGRALMGKPELLMLDEPS